MDLGSKLERSEIIIKIKIVVHQLIVMANMSDIPDTIPYAKIVRSKKEAKKTRSANMCLMLISLGPISSNIWRNCVKRTMYPI